MKHVTIREAWQFVDNEFPDVNVYDTYVSGHDWMKTMDNANERYRISKEIIAVERAFGITRLQDKVMLLQEKLDVLTLPLFGYKYSIPEDIEKEVKEEHRKTKKLIAETEKNIDELYDTLSIEESILHNKILT